MKIRVDVDSEEGRGTIFRIFLPALKKNKEEKIRIRKFDKVLHGRGTILFVDDEETVLAVGSQMLEAMGYNVLSAGNGEEAVEIYRKNEGNIDLVLLDMVMPKMGGSTTYDRLKEINPDIKVILVSGFSFNDEASEILKRGCNGFIQKPYNMRELSNKIQEILKKQEI